MKTRKVIPFPKQKKSPITYKGGVLQFSAILEEVSERYCQETGEFKEEDRSDEECGEE
ncbi:MAG: hypothetical protein JW836_15320 [Deltaproteobacteria bacterium]|nr:hypothetical protein [Deltaproteobacteria bacterium]